MAKAGKNEMEIIGIKERLEDILEEDVYFRYGELVAAGKMEFQSTCLDDSGRLMMDIAKHRESGRPSLSW